MSENINISHSAALRPQAVIPPLATRQQIIDRYLNSLKNTFDLLKLAPVILYSATAKALGIREELKLQVNGIYDEMLKPCFFGPGMSNINGFPTYVLPSEIYNNYKSFRALIEEYTHKPSSHKIVQMLAKEMS